MTENKKTGNEVWKDVGWFALKTTAISGAVLGGVAVAVPLMGFTAGGVAAGSLAAFFQSAFLGGTIASGSTFAVLQSVGAAGLAAGTQGAVVAASAVAAGAHTVANKIKKKSKDKKSNRPRRNSSESKNGTSSSEVESSEEEDEETVDEREESNSEVTIQYQKKLPFGTLSFKKESKLSDCGASSQIDKVLLQSVDTASLGKKNCVMPPVNSAWEEVELSDDVCLTKSLIKKGILQ